ncbi:hypothetical protein LINPERHAP1_LOCUS36401 [Linum perenne]
MKTTNVHSLKGRGRFLITIFQWLNGLRSSMKRIQSVKS